MLNPAVLTVGNDELGGPLGDAISCPHCGKAHLVEFGEKVLDDGSREPSRALAFYRCDKKTYLCGINGREFLPKPERKG